MRVIPFVYSLALSLFAFVSVAASSPCDSNHVALYRAFPTAEGYGAHSRGGRGGDVILVDPLLEDRPAAPIVNSFRWAIEELSQARIILFSRSGTIVLKNKVVLRSPNVTIAGHSAPGEGITLAMANPAAQAVLKIHDTHDIVIRNIRLRMGKGNRRGRGDNLQIVNSRRIIVDHLSISWSNDENIGITRTSVDSPATAAITIQHSILSEPLHTHSTNMLIGGGKDLSLDNPYESAHKLGNISILNNLFASSTHRNPKVGGRRIEVVNNVICDYHDWSLGVTGDTTVDFANNFLCEPLQRNASLFTHMTRVRNSNAPSGYTPFPDASIYLSGNIVENLYQDASTDLWPLLEEYYQGGAIPRKHQRTKAMKPNTRLFTYDRTDAYTAYENTVKNLDVGNSFSLRCNGTRRKNYDSVDWRVLANTLSRQQFGAPVHENDVEGYPQLKEGLPCIDNNHNDLPDAWEQLYDFTGSHTGDYDGDGWSDLEEFLNETDPTRFDEGSYICVRKR